MEVITQLNNLRIAPRKVRLLSGVLKGVKAAQAEEYLKYVAKRSAGPMRKLVSSAMANAQNNFGLVKENMYIKQIIVGEGPKLKRFRPKGFGMTSPIEKKTSRITLILDERIPGLKSAPEGKTKMETDQKPEKTVEKKTGYKKMEEEKGKQRKIAMLIRAYDPCITCATH